MSTVQKRFVLKGILSLAAVSVAAASAFAAYPVLHHGTIARITDGDTIRFNSQEKHNQLKIRMVSIDAPEHHFPVPGGGIVAQGHFGEMATHYLATLLKVNSHGQLKDYGLDKYGRTLGRVYYRNQDLNYKMVEAGMAIPYFICSGETCDRDFNTRFEVPKYVKACLNARAHGLGIFNPKDPLREMPFEFRNRMRHEAPHYYVGDLRTSALYNPADYGKVDLCYRIFFFNLSDAHKAGYR